MVCPALLLTALLASPAPGGAADAPPDVLLVRYALLVGGREAGNAPAAAGVLSQEELTKVLIDWNPGADNAEVRRIFALNHLGEVVRQAVELPLAGGRVQGVFSYGGASFEVRLDVQPARDGTLTLGGRILRNNQLLSAPTVRQAMGQRAILSSAGGAESPFLFFVVEVDQASRAALAQQSGLAWPKRVKVVDGKKIPAPKVLKSVDAVYTPAAKKARVEGAVVLRLLVGETGDVEEVEVLKGLSEGLTDAAVKAVRQWKFEPVRVEGKPVEAFFTITMNFELD